MPQVDLLIFDLDGTLVDSRQDLTFCVNQTLVRYHRPPLSQETVVRYVGDGIHKLMERAIPDADADFIAEAVEAFRRCYSEHLLDHSVLYPGIREALSQLKDRRMAVVTNKPTAFAERILAGLDVRQLFPVILGGDAVQEMKPSPLPLLEVMERLHVSPKRTAMIGDSKGDVVAGRQAGVWTCWVSWGFRAQGDLQGVEPDFVAHAPADLVRLFGEQEGEGRTP